MTYQQAVAALPGVYEALIAAQLRGDVSAVIQAQLTIIALRDIIGRGP